ncbi:NAD-dependent epimerase/dehydratase family protein [Phyllobacterium endophyticum]|uniref:NAD-dependent epimerase/dehydratase family protein n=1 Tax=Phyllobacterium endophyticum TaxID=1149773 RepID=UPI001AEE7FD3|nr:NAD(P)-dependent oxidoreductase [Phyllobacterium endophyticum]
MRYLVTGGHGYIGRHVVTSLVSRGHHVIVASRGVDAPIEGSVPFNGDILIPNDDIFEQSGRPDVLIHLAWEDGFMHASPAHLDNLSKHVTFVKNMLRGGLRHIATAGTVHEIGFHIGPVDETTPTFPLHPYGVAKNHLRSVQSLLCKEYDVTDQWLRCYYILGDDKRNNSIFTKLLQSESDGKVEFPLNTGELLYDFIHVRELANMIVDVTEQQEVTGIINCCTGDPISLKTMITRFIEENGLKIKPVWGAFPLRPYDSRAIWGSTAKLDAIRRQ